MFSTGKDSLAMLDLAAQYMPGRFTCIHQYFYPELSYRDKFISLIEKRYGVEIHREPHPEMRYLLQKEGVQVSKLSFVQDEDRLRDKYGIAWIMYGYKKADSLFRRGMLKHLEYGIDEKSHRSFPLGEWSENQVMQYLKTKKIPLPIEYQHGYRDINIFSGAAVIWLYNNFREDYDNIKTRYPSIEADLLKAMKKHGLEHGA